MRTEKSMGVEYQDNIADEGARAVHAHSRHGEAGWELNPYEPTTNEYKIWLAGYVAEVERSGSEGQDW